MRNHRWLSNPDKVALVNDFMLTCKKAALGLGNGPTVETCQAVEAIIFPLLEIYQDNPPGLSTRKRVW